MSDTNNMYRGIVIVRPSVDLRITPRAVGEFSVRSDGPGRLVAESMNEDAFSRFVSKDFLRALDVLAWDMLWEAGIAVQFEPGTGSRSNVDYKGRTLQMLYVRDTISAAEGNPKAGLEQYQNFDLLQRIRDHLINTHLAQGNSARNSTLLSHAELLLAIERYVKALMIPDHALPHLYSLVETIENRCGGRHALVAFLPKKELDHIVSIANQPQYDQRHGPQDPLNVQPLPPNALSDAIKAARSLITAYAESLV